MTREDRDALAFLHARGARFVKLRPDTKVPIGGGWDDGDPIPLAEIAAHCERGGALGIVPWSLRCAVVDVDGGKLADGSQAEPGAVAELAEAIIDWIGADPFAVLHSASGLLTGKRHLWYLFADGIEAPLGRLASGAPRKLSGGLHLDGPGTAFDTRCMTGYVRCDTYLADLAEAWRQAAGKPRDDLSKLAEIDDRGRRDRVPAKRPSRPPSEASAEAGNDLREGLDPASPLRSDARPRSFPWRVDGFHRILVRCLSRSF